MTLAVLLALSGCGELSVQARRGTLIVYNPGPETASVSAISGLYDASSWPVSMAAGTSVDFGSITTGPQTLSQSGGDTVTLEVPPSTALVHTLGAEGCWFVGNYNALYTHADGDVVHVAHGSGTTWAFDWPSASTRILRPEDTLPDSISRGSTLFRVNPAPCDAVARGDTAVLLESGRRP